MFEFKTFDKTFNKNNKSCFDNLLKLKDKSDSKLLSKRYYFPQNINNSLISKELLSLERNTLWIDCKNKSNSDNNRLLFADLVRFVTIYKLNNSDFCGNNFGNDLQLLVFVFSRVNAFWQREAIRKTWAQFMNRKNSEIKILFLLGATNDTSIQNMVTEEYKQYSSIAVHWRLLKLHS